MITENEKNQGLMALRKLIRKKLVQVSGVNPYSEMPVESAYLATKQTDQPKIQISNEVNGKSN
ncbi:MAG TPA: hypothetical protein PLQ93_10725 [Bacteroidia bacterium]|nr:hypothetical protein [Bacteroidia bacterium]